MPILNINQAGNTILTKGSDVILNINKDIPVQWSLKQNYSSDFEIYRDQKDKKKIILKSKKDFHNNQNINVEKLNLDRDRISLWQLFELDVIEIFKERNNCLIKFKILMKSLRNCFR